MVKLTERARVKDYAKIARADTLHDGLINDMIEQASEEIQDLTRREFEKKQRTEYHTSYEQTAFDPEPQIVLANAWPIDEGETIELIWSPYDHREGLTTELTQANEDFTVDAEKGFIWVRSNGGLVNNLPLLGTTIFSYAPRGFKLTYTGGYEVTTEPQGHTADPLDDFGVAQVPESLKNIVAQKIAKDLVEMRFLRPFEDADRKLLKPWTKKDMI